MSGPSTPPTQPDQPQQPQHPDAREELTRGSQEIADRPGPRVDWLVLLASAAVILAFSLWTMLAPAQSGSVLWQVVGWIARDLGRFYVVFPYRWGMPLSLRAALYPLLGKRVRGRAGDVIDIFALIGTVFGVATSMGIGVVLLNGGFSLLFGLPQGSACRSRSCSSPW